MAKKYMKNIITKIREWEEEGGSEVLLKGEVKNVL